MNPSQPGNATKEPDVMEPIEQAARASERAAGKAAEDTRRLADAAVGAGDRAMRASVEMMQRNAETVQQTLRSGAKLAAQMTERSADRLGRAMGFSGESAQKAAQRSTSNIEAIVQSGTVLTEMTRRFCEEWADLARTGMDRNLDRIDALFQCRTPQDFAVLQSELLRDNMECLLGYAHKVGEHSVRLADEAKRQFARLDSRLTEGRRAVA